MLLSLEQKIEKNFAEHQRQLHKICQDINHDPSQITTIAVSKKQSREKIELALNLGCRNFGENRVEEALRKWPELKKNHRDLVLHFVGGLQGKKTDDALRLFDVIHSLDRPSLAENLEKSEKKFRKTGKYFIQVKLADEPQKSGINVESLRDFYLFCSKDKALNIIGLMTLPPKKEPAAPYFEFLRRLASELGLSHLSMGMSADYETAVRFGATHIRLGTSLFGQRAE